MIDPVILVNVCSVLVFVTGFAKNWFLAKGTLKPVYVLNIIMGAALCLVNVGVVMEVPKMAGILSFMILNFWVSLMGFKGLWRLRQERQNYLQSWGNPPPVPYRCHWDSDRVYVCFCATAPCKDWYERILTVRR